jgi:hypothetical protein
MPRAGNKKPWVRSTPTARFTTEPAMGALRQGHFSFETADELEDQHAHCSFLESGDIILNFDFESNARARRLEKRWRALVSF